MPLMSFQKAVTAALPTFTTVGFQTNYLFGVTIMSFQCAWLFTRSCDYLNQLIQNNGRLGVAVRRSRVKLEMWNVKRLGFFVWRRSRLWRPTGGTILIGWAITYMKFERMFGIWQPILCEGIEHDYTTKPDKITIVIPIKLKIVKL